jgi:molybdate transport system substrate-binding protein
VFFTNLLQQWKLTGSFASKTRPMDDGPSVSGAVARGEADLGVLPVSEIVTVPGVEVAGVFPPELGGVVVMEAAAAAGKVDAPHVKAFVEFLSSPESVAAFKRHGFE